jgi:DNA-binding transcriptional LysR family regulator
MDDRLQKFMILVEAGTYTEAAKRLHISQPALSVAIHKLERSLKTTLIGETTKQGVVLTEAGRVVYTAATNHRALDHNLQLELSQLRGERASLTIGLVDSVATLLSQQESVLAMLEHETDLTLYVASSTQLRKGVEEGAIDLAIVVANEATDAQFQVVATAAEKMYMVTRIGQSKSVENAIRQEEMISLISYTPTSSTHAVIQRALAVDGIRVDTALFSTSPAVMLAMVLRGKGVAILPETVIAADLAAGNVETVFVEGAPYIVKRELHVIAHKGRALPPKLAGLAQAVRLYFRAFPDVDL